MLDIDECDIDPDRCGLNRIGKRKGNCINEIGSYTCKCDGGYINYNRTEACIGTSVVRLVY